jgi:tetratricopeptide (TPR) repeat protein
MIFYSLEAILLHPGKTAGTSFERWLNSGGQPDPYTADRTSLFGWDPEFGVFLQHATCKLSRELVGATVYDNFFKFVIVRDPYSRLASVYRYSQAQIQQEGCRSFRDFVLGLPERMQRPGVANGLHICSQVAYSHIDGQLAVDYVGRFEDLDSVGERVRQQLQLDHPLPHVNQSVRPIGAFGSEKCLYDPQMISVMQEVYAADFSTFAYPDQPEQRLLSLEGPPSSGKVSKVDSVPRIFVQIPSYRDPECQHTIKDLFDKAAHPKRVFVGVCWQFDPDEDADCFVVPAPLPEQVRALKFHYREARGLGWARQQAQTLYRGEEFTLQIDAHMRFSPGWDELLITMLAKCPGEKKILSHYPPSFIQPDRYQSESVPYMYPGRINDAGIPMEKSFTFGTDVAPPAPIPNFFVAGGMIFAPSTLFEEVPPDPDIYFWGEQIATAVRAWTRGWDIYSPNQNSVYHIYHESAERPLNWDDNPEWVERTRVTAARMQYLLGISDSLPEEFDTGRHLLELGSARTLKEYERSSGIDFKARRVESSLMSEVVGRLRKSGAKVSDEAAEWYRSLMLIDEINYRQDYDWIEHACRRFCDEAKMQQHRYAVLLHAARRYLDAHQQEQALAHAFEAMKISPRLSNAPSMVARVLLRQGKYQLALAYSALSEALLLDNEFRPIVFKEPHPLTIQALIWCKYQQPEQTRLLALRAREVEQRFTTELDEILETPFDPVAKEHWLFPDKKANFSLYRSKTEIAAEWVTWAKTNIARGSDLRAVEITLLDVGYAPELVQRLLQEIPSPTASAP